MRACLAPCKFLPHVPDGNLFGGGRRVSSLLLGIGAEVPQNGPWFIAKGAEAACALCCLNVFICTVLLLPAYLVDNNPFTCCL